MAAGKAGRADEWGLPSTNCSSEDEANPAMAFAEPETEPTLVGASRLPRRSEQKHEMRVTAYRAMDVPWGFANMLAHEDPSSALRVFLLDNSGSTSQCDGHVLQRDAQGHLRSAPATRWDEIRGLALAHAEWNARAGVRSEFLLLNPPCPHDPAEGRDYVTVDPKAGSPAAQVEVLATVLRNNGPKGVTPLAARLDQLRRRLQREVKGGMRIMLTIVTDGLPTAATSGTCTDGDKAAFVQELRTFAASFNVFIVIRLATDEDSAIQYYNAIDEELELPLDILDDLRGEAEELKACGNGWLTYTPLIHKIREGCTAEKLFDILDERPLKLPEVARFLELLFQGPKDPPFPRRAEELYEFAREGVAQAPRVYNGRLDCMSPPVDLKLLKKALGLTAGQRMKRLPSRVIRAMTCSSHLPRD